MSLGIYIHLPYCLTKCPYCDFNSYGVGDNFPEEAYTSALLREIDIYSEYIKDRKVSSIFFGGGTPSLFKPVNIEKIISKLGDYSTITDGTEITLEINPKTAGPAKLQSFREIGINRASVGIQSFSERKLKFYGRLNTPEEGMEVLKNIAEAQFENFNLDLIYGSTNESLDELRRDIEISLEYNTTHVSAYCLTIEDGTQFGNLYKRGLLKLPDDTLLSEMYELTATLFPDNGYHHYEISNFSKPGYECRHNLIYWECESYIGFGAGAHSHLSYKKDSPWGKRWANVRNPEKYMNLMCSNSPATDFAEVLSCGESLADKLMMGLRLNCGVDYKKLENHHKAEFKYESLIDLIERDWLELTVNRLRITDKGRVFSNELINRAVAAFNILN